MRRAFLCVLLAACGGDDNATVPDASTVDAAFDPARCLIKGDYGALGAVTGTTSQGPTTLTVVLDQGPPRDSFFLKLNTGKGAFSGGLAIGTFPLTGTELDYANCGVCVNIIADIVAMQGPSKFYFATGGSVTLTSHTPPAGMLTNVTLQEVTATGTPVPGCNASIASMSFSGT